ncbi:MAG: coiled-coil domain-containing protein [Planctomycetota bacterium]
MRAGARTQTGAPLRSLAAALLLMSSGLPGAGCVGYLTGSYDTEMQRLRAVVAELEAKNAALAEECIDLRERVKELAGDGGPASGGGGGGGPDAATAEAGAPDT